MTFFNHILSWKHLQGTPRSKMVVNILMYSHERNFTILSDNSINPAPKFLLVKGPMVAT